MYEDLPTHIVQLLFIKDTSKSLLWDVTFNIFTNINQKILQAPEYHFTNILIVWGYSYEKSIITPDMFLI